MQKPVHFLIFGCLLAVLLTACAASAAPQAAATSAPAQPAGELTPLPTFTALASDSTAASTSAPSSIPTTAPATAAPPTAALSAATAIPTRAAGPAVVLDQIHMLNAHDGWGWAAQQGALSQLLRTGDGGQTWTDVSPKPGSGSAYNYYGSFFLDGQTAWLTYFDSTANNGGLLYTKDGGQNWSNLPPNQYLQNARVQFSSATDGVAETADMGAGQAHLTYYQTQDAGNTWKVVAISAPNPEDGMPAGTLHLCNICGDQLYYDPARVIIAQGDMANDPVGVVRISVSADLGKTWTNLQLALPAKYAGGSVAPMQPVFFGQTGLLPVNIIKYDQKNALTFSALVVYVSQDGGQTWQPAPGELENPLSQINNVQILSAKDVFVVCGKNLCASNDGAQTWKTLSGSLNFDQSTGAADAVTMFNFIDPQNGWAVSGQSGATTLWQSQDGGATWAKMSPTLNK